MRDKLLQVICYLRDNVHPEFPAQQLALLFEVASNPGVTYQDLEKSLGMPHGSVSRNVKAMTKWRTSQGERRGYDLLRIEPNEWERRQFSLFLSDRGKQMVEEIESILGS